MQMDTERMQTELKMIVAEGNTSGVLPFLEQYKQGNVEILKTTLNDIRLYWWYYKDFPNNLEFNPQHDRTRRPTADQYICIALFALSLLDSSDVKNGWDNLFKELPRIMQDFNLNNIFIKIKPIWLKEYVQQMQKKVRGTYYSGLRSFEQHNLIEFEPQVFATALSSVAYTFNAKDGVRTDLTVQSYTTDEIRVKRDIPLLFDYETNLYEQGNGSAEQKIWHIILVQLIHENKLDRAFLMQKIIEIQSRNWRLHAKNFFKRLLTAIEPTVAELLAFQDQLFALLHNEHSGTVNFALDTLKPILLDADFKLAEYLTWLEAVMMRTDAKNSVKTILSQIPKLFSKHAELQIQMLNLAADALLQTDLNVQERAAKLLAKYVKPEHDTVIAKIRLYQDHLIGDNSALLQPYLAGDHGENNNAESHTINNTTSHQKNHVAYHYQMPQPRYLNQDKQVFLPKNWQELLFFMGETVNSTNPLNFDILMSAWLKLKPQFPPDYKKQLKPILKQMDKWRDRAFPDLFNSFFIHSFPATDKILDKYPYSIKFLGNYHGVLTKFAQFSHSDIALPLLSLPTHSPSYIDPEVLVQRLLAYQDAKVTSHIVDLAIALCRTPRENVEPALALLPQIRQTALRELLYFAFGALKPEASLAAQSALDGLTPEAQLLWRGLWDTVIQTHDVRNKSDIALPYQFSPHIELSLNKDTQKYDHLEIGKNIRFSLPAFNQTWTYIYQNLCYETHLRQHHNLTGSDLVFHSHFTPLHQIPNDLHYAANTCYWVDLSAKDISLFLIRMIEEDYILNPYSLFILAGYSFSSNKEARLTVSEVLIQCFAQQKVNLDILSKHYVTLLESNYAPFPRLFECLLSVKGVAALSDQALLILILNIFQKYAIPEKIPTQFKKLFELYYELAHQYKVKLSQSSIDALLVWQQQFDSLKSIIQKIIKEVS